MKAAFGALAIVFLGCAAKQDAEHIPPISVDQEGISQRLLATAPQTEQEQAPPEAGEPAESPTSSTPAESSDPSPDDEMEQSESRDHPNKPDETSSGARVAFQTVPANEAQRKSGPRVPKDEFTPRRDEQAKRHLRRSMSRVR